MGAIHNLGLWMINAVGVVNYLGIFILMALESSIVPIPSELVLIPAGYLVFQGKMSIILLFSVALVGSLAGSIVSYYLAYFAGRKTVERLIGKYGKAFLLNRESLEKTDSYFEKHGQITVFTARFIPGVRHLISLPAGFSNMNKSMFLIYTGLGAGIWNAVLISMGYYFGRNQDFLLKNWMIFTVLTVLVMGIIILVYFIAHKIRKRKK